MSLTQLEELETSIEKAKTSIELGKSLERLIKNPDFKKVFLHHLFVEESIKMVHVYGNSLNESHVNEAKKAMITISGVRKFMDTLVENAERARISLKDSTDVREQILNEG